MNYDYLKLVASPQFGLYNASFSSAVNHLEVLRSGVTGYIPIQSIQELRRFIHA